MHLGAGPEEILRERRVLICILRDPWTLCFWFCVHFSYFHFLFLIPRMKVTEKPSVQRLRLPDLANKIQGTQIDLHFR